MSCESTLGIRRTIALSKVKEIIGDDRYYNSIDKLVEREGVRVARGGVVPEGISAEVAVVNFGESKGTIFFVGRSKKSGEKIEPDQTVAYIFIPDKQG